MAKVYAPPIEMPPPPDLADFLSPGNPLDFQALRAAETQWIEDLAALARSQSWVEDLATVGSGSTDLVGEVVHFPIADGAAMYMIWRTKPLELIHLPIGDAWQIPEAHARGLRVSDLRDQIEADRRLRELFRSKA